MFVRCDKSVSETDYISEWIVACSLIENITIEKHK